MGQWEQGAVVENDLLLVIQWEAFVFLLLFLQDSDQLLEIFVAAL
jgi:hypothetical protein